MKKSVYLLVWLLVLISTYTSAQDKIELSLEPEKLYIPQGTICSSSIEIFNNRPWWFLEFQLSFDPDVIEIVDVRPICMVISGINVGPEQLIFQTTDFFKRRIVWDNQQGFLFVDLGLFPDKSFPPGTVVVLEIVWYGKNVGFAEVGFRRNRSFVGLNGAGEVSAVSKEVYFDVVVRRNVLE